MHTHTHTQTALPQCAALRKGIKERARAGNSAHEYEYYSSHNTLLACAFRVPNKTLRTFVRSDEAVWYTLNETLQSHPRSRPEWNKMYECRTLAIASAPCVLHPRSLKCILICASSSVVVCASFAQLRRLVVVSRDDDGTTIKCCVDIRLGIMLCVYAAGACDR